MRLGVLFAVAIAALLVVRHLFVPKTFGQFGHYRGAAVEAIASKPIHYAGWQTCAECHEEGEKLKSTPFHRNLSCETCHGPSFAHASNPDSTKPIVPRQRKGPCLYCHNYLASRPTGFPQIIESVHNPTKPCINCHDPHAPTPPEVPGSCGACHAEIYRTKSVSHHSSLTCETCHNAPPEHKEDPRAHLPTKPTSRDFCGQCHADTSSAPREIPRIDLAKHGGRYLCWQCHYPHSPED